MKTRHIVGVIFMALLAGFDWWVITPPSHCDLRGAWMLGVIWGCALVSTLSRW